MYDSKCYDLAEAWLELEEDQRLNTEDNKKMLAQVLQQTIEDFIEEYSKDLIQMTKRASGQFGRRDMDHYPTPAAAVTPLVPHLVRTRVRTFAEPCCGEGDLVGHLQTYIFKCVAQGDLRDGLDARAWTKTDFNGADASITNPPWEALTMAGIMEHQSGFVPSWFLIYSDWIFTKQSARLMRDRCTDIVPIGRVKWFPESKSVGYDNCAWVRMDARKNSGVEFWPFP